MAEVLDEFPLPMFGQRWVEDEDPECGDELELDVCADVDLLAAQAWPMPSPPTVAVAANPKATMDLRSLPETITHHLLSLWWTPSQTGAPEGIPRVG